MSSPSFASDLSAYLAERLCVPRIALLWVIAMLCVLALTARPETSSIILGGLLMAPLIAQFRVWDDWSDRAHDATTHPARVMVRTTHAQEFAQCVYLTSLPVGIVIVTSYGTKKLLAYAALLVGFACLYSALAHKLPRLARAHLVLLKYPAFVWLCVPQADPARWACLGAALFCGLALFELASDSTLRVTKYWRWLAAAEALILIGLLALSLVRISP